MYTAYDCIYPQDKIVGGNCFVNCDDRPVVEVFDTSPSGIMYRVDFEQNGRHIFMSYNPMGKVYYKLAAKA